ncbi:uncharacterized protein BCR38DRAFT_432060 [Pseudomassariella vexata]|uniref:Uncharacterized protein n=1 Tax=Pseudomassariella vexata TaxID=1141098 RepID=A0A1Y2E0V9_9PEZI|nr:uncharacterized protein BCR38DRAFT_432060 [Pseudomassariella vexata]ORY65172.1 hypothetical protein BCR38DRAFT_432060 [Pseudomassariella vexata]
MLSKFVSLLALMAATASAQNQTGPFAVKITGKTNSSIDGYLTTCHAGAAIEALCYGTSDTSSNYNQFYYNYSSYSPDTGEVYQPGYLIWNLPLNDGSGTIQNVSSAVNIQPNWGSNVAAALFQPSYYDATYFSFDSNGTFFLSGGVDDASFNETRPMTPTYLGDLTNFHLCYQYTGGYYYQSIAWVFTLPPRNPTCQPVNLTKVAL